MDVHPVFGNIIMKLGYSINEKNPKYSDSCYFYHKENH